MKKALFSPLISVLVMLLLAFAFPLRSIVLNLSDTYYVLDLWDLALLFATYFAMLGIAYWILRNSIAKLLRPLSNWHLLLSSLFSLMMFSFGLWQESADLDIMLRGKLQGLMTLSLGLFILVQFLFPLNLILSIIQKKKS